jgi:hypothetical protein
MGTMPTANLCEPLKRFPVLGLDLPLHEDRNQRHLVHERILEVERWGVLLET